MSVYLIWCNKLPFFQFLTQICGEVIKLNTVNHRANKNEQEKTVMGVQLGPTKLILQQEKEQKV
jgi:hypothetical protein